MNRRSWTDIGSDVNWMQYGGRWARHVDGTRYHVIRFDNWNEYEREPREQYLCELVEVDLASEQLDSARQCCGYAEDWRDEYGDPLPDECKVGALASYGAYRMLHQASGNNARELMRAAKRASR